MELKNTQCALCGAWDGYRILYPSNVQASDFNSTVFSARRIADKLHYQIVECKRDHLVRSNPVYDSSQLAQVYRESRLNYEDQIANLTATYREALALVVSGLSPSAKILEVGCGNGFMLKDLRDRGFVNVHGVEPSQDAAQKADPQIRGVIKNDIFREGLWGPGTFDLIFFFQTLDHVPDPQAFLNICRDLLAPDGTVLAFNHDVRALAARVLGERSPIIDMEHAYLYSRDTMQKMFLKCGLNPTRIVSPVHTISWRYLIGLLPGVPAGFKRRIQSSTPSAWDALLNRTIRLPLGNICLTARKAS